MKKKRKKLKFLNLRQITIFFQERSKEKVVNKFLNSQDVIHRTLTFNGLNLTMDYMKISL